MATVRITEGNDYVSVTGTPDFIDWAVKSFWELRASEAAKVKASERAMRNQQLLTEHGQAADAISSLKGKLRVIEQRLKWGA